MTLAALSFFFSPSPAVDDVGRLILLDVVFQDGSVNGEFRDDIPLTDLVNPFERKLRRQLRSTLNVRCSSGWTYDLPSIKGKRNSSGLLTNERIGSRTSYGSVTFKNKTPAVLVAFSRLFNPSGGAGPDDAFMLSVASTVNLSTYQGRIVLSWDSVRLDEQRYSK